MEQRKKPRWAAALSGTREIPDFRLTGLFVFVLVFVDLPAGLVLFLVELVLLGLGQVTVVGGHIGLFLVLGLGFAILQVRGLSRRELIVFDAIGDAVLLVLLAGIHFADARMIGIDDSRSRAGCVVLGL